MKKTIKTITMVLMFTLLITACDKDKKNDVNTSKEITNKPKVEVQTTIVEVTDATGEPVTNSKGEKVTEVLTVPTTAKKGITGNSNAIVESTTKSKTSETAKNSEKTTTTTKKSNSSQAPPTTTKPQPVNPPTTQPTQPQNPYGYVNAWGTLAQMENDCKAYAESMGMKYDSTLNLGNGHWVTPLSSYGATSSQNFKDLLCREDRITAPQSIGYDTIRYLFVTMDNYKDGRCVGHEDNAELFLCGTKDKIVIYTVLA